MNRYIPIPILQHITIKYTKDIIIFVETSVQNAIKCREQTYLFKTYQGQKKNTFNVLNFEFLRASKNVNNININNNLKLSTNILCLNCIYFLFHNHQLSECINFLIVKKTRVSHRSFHVKWFNFRELPHLPSFDFDAIQHTSSSLHQMSRCKLLA